MIKLIVGLGNIGEKYENTRHNIGFELVNSFIKNNNGLFDKNDFNGIYSIISINDQKIIVLKPSTYMNLSGKSVIACMNFFKIKIDEIIIIYDDINLEIGKYKYKKSGASAGHNGIKDIINLLGSEEIKRIKIGIGSKPVNMDLSDFVLSKFKKEQKEEINKTINKITNELSKINIIDFSNLKKE